MDELEELLNRFFQKKKNVSTRSQWTRRDSSDLRGKAMEYTADIIKEFPSEGVLHIRLLPDGGYEINAYISRDKIK